MSPRTLVDLDVMFIVLRATFGVLHLGDLRMYPGDLLRRVHTHTVNMSAERPCGHPREG